MRLVEVNWNPSDRQLRQFGLTALVALPLLAWMWSGDSTTDFNPTVVGIAAAVAVVVAAVGLIWPRAVKPLFIGLTVAGIPIGMVVGEIAMALTFYGLFVPLGLAFRLMGRDVLNLKLDRPATTYWQRKKKPADPASYLRQW